jgi:hypothetical protein
MILNRGRGTEVPMDETQIRKHTRILEVMSKIMIDYLQKKKKKEEKKEEK